MIHSCAQVRRAGVMAANGEVSSEEYVEDDSPEEEEEEEEEESDASFGSEEDETGLAGDDSDVFETPLKPRKRAKLVETPTPTAGGSNKNASAANTSPKSSQTKKAAAGKGKGRATNPLKASPVSGECTPASPGGKDAHSSPQSSKTGIPMVCSNVSIVATPADATPAPGGVSASLCSGGQGSGVKGGGGGEGEGKGQTMTPASAGAAAPQPKAKTPKGAVSDYMFQANRPYSYINVFDNLHKKIPKAMVQKILDELTKDGTVAAKEYGKSKIYFANQNALPDGAGDVSDAKLARLEKDAKDLTKSLEIISSQARAAQARVQSLSAQPTDASLDEKLAATDQEMEQMETRNASIKGLGHNATAGGMKTAKADFNKYRAMWLERKRNAMEVVDMVADGMDKKTKQIMEMLGLEPDEEPIPAKM